ncbi:AmmeMemoRadiSam system radical SAM enzyme [Tepiditoga spiralis]|uniref:AmmeMemoRadiSam system radical SAM enzyme n=1 Tax=Tepiditoga spiralis TaxID=2108365 RepID=A0A7G1G6H3_9BACT|nr:AmmeMemoRadiSam system radical SAM enzyme [Tepiditoga spiralis]BBE32041.1 AmmeMemoRadiSam system radical SAM enzyme [Tepiditoga spiralis]
MKKILSFYKATNESIKCELCPNECLLKNGQTGLCKTIKNIDNKLYSLNYEEISSISIDPIEKKPIFHYHPGDKVLSIGSWGCNLKCPFCQNFEISQFKPNYLSKVKANEIPLIINEKNVNGIAYTYSEPLSCYEYVYESCVQVKKYNENYYNILVTNGFINEYPFEKLLNYIDAVNIDLKTFNSKNYMKYLKGNLKNVLNSIELAFQKDIHVELTTLIVPKISDNLHDLEEEFKWISHLSKNIPLHISKYYPIFKYNESKTSRSLLIKIYEMAKKYLNYVYIGNLWEEKYESTFCPNCGNLLIKRNGYKIQKINLDEHGGCKTCGQKIIKY